MLDIYTVYGGDMLYHFFMALSGVTSDPVYITLLVASVLFMAFIQIGNLVLSQKGDLTRVIMIMATLAVFITPVGVNIVDISSGKEYPIPVGVQIATGEPSGVPFAVGGMAYFASNVGYGLTTLFDTYFSDPSMNNEAESYGPATYNIASRVFGMLGYYSTRSSTDKYFISNLSKDKDDPILYNYKTSVIEYMDRCYYPWVSQSIENQKISEKHFSSPNFFEAVAKDPTAAEPGIDYSGTVIQSNLPGQAAGTNIAFCRLGADNENATLLLAQLHEMTADTGEFTNDLLNKALQAQLLSYLIDTKLITKKQVDDNKVLGCTSSNELDNADCIMNKAAKMLSSDAHSPYLMAMSAFNHGMTKEGRYQYENRVGSPTIISTLESATMQRNAQSGADLAMTEKMMPYMISFFTVLIYSLAPFALIVFTTGLSGTFAYLGKYFSMYLFVSIFMPIMAIGNYFVTLNMREVMDGMGSFGGGSLNSMNMLPSVVAQIQDTNHIAALMLGATPIIALMIVTGSYYAMTQLARQMSGGDHFNEKNVAPDTSSHDPVTKTTGLITNEATGTNTQGRVAGVDFSMARMLNNSEQNTESSAGAIQSSLTESMQSNLSSSNAASHQIASIADASSAHSVSIGSDSKFNQTLASTFGEDKALSSGFNQEWKNQMSKTDSSSETWALMSAINAKLGVGGEKGIGEAGVNLTGSGSWKQDWTKQEADMIMDVLSKSDGVKDSQTAALKDDLADSYSIGSNIQEAGSEKESVSESESVVEQLSKVDGYAESEDYKKTTSYLDSYQQTQALQESASATVKMNDRDFAYSLKRNEDAHAAMQNLYRTNEDFRNMSDSEAGKLSPYMNGDEAINRGMVRSMAFAMENDKIFSPEERDIVNSDIMAPVLTNSSNDVDFNSDKLHREIDQPSDVSKNLTDKGQELGNAHKAVSTGTTANIEAKGELIRGKIAQDTINYYEDNVDKLSLKAGENGSYTASVPGMTNTEYRLSPNTEPGAQPGSWTGALYRKETVDGKENWREMENKDSDFNNKMLGGLKREFNEEAVRMNNLNNQNTISNDAANRGVGENRLVEGTPGK